MTRIASASLAALALLVLTAAGCGGGGSDTTTGATETTSTTTTTTTAPAPPPPPPPPPATPRKTVTIVVKNGKVVGGLDKTTVDKGTKVTLVVRSDVADEVHLHGYDLAQDVAPGAPAKIAFVASIPGRFEIELEDRALQIADLQVNP